MKSKGLNKGVLYSIFGTVMSVALIALIAGIVFFILGVTKNYSVWIFGKGSQEVLPIFIGASFLLLALPALVILMIESKKLRKIAVATSVACVCITTAVVTVTMLTAPNNYYTTMVSDNGRYTIIICEASKGDLNEVIFYQLYSDNLMRKVSTTRCICEGYRPISSGNVEIEWSAHVFTVKIPDDGEGDYLRQSFTCKTGKTG